MSEEMSSFRIGQKSVGMNVDSKRLGNIWKDNGAAQSLIHRSPKEANRRARGMSRADRIIFSSYEAQLQKIVK